MRRWWAKVGSWWMVGLGLLLIFDTVQFIDVFQQHQSGNNGYRAFSSTWDWFQWIHGLYRSSTEITIAIALLCAFNVVAIIDNIFKDTPVFNESAIRTYKFRLALLNCWPTLFLIVPWTLLNNYAFEFVMNGSVSIWLWINGSLEYLLTNSIWVVWLVAIAVVTPNSRWAAWALITGGLLATGAAYVLEIGLPGAIVFPAYFPHEFSDMHVSILKGSGFILIYGLFQLYLIGKTKAVNLLCIGFSVVLLLDGIHAGFGFTLLDQFLQFGKHLSAGMQPLYFSFQHEFYVNDIPSLLMWVGGFKSSFQVGHAWAIVPVLSSTFWLFAHYLAFSWLMRRKVTRTDQGGN